MTRLALLAALAFAAFLFFRRADHALDPRLALEHWSVVSDGVHNSNTDMIEWRGELLLVHAAFPWHLASTRSRLLIKRSSDGRHWETLATLRVPGHDIRDPKLAVIGGRLHLHALPNQGVMATPTHTVLSTRDDARRWTEFEPVGPPGWLFWRPKSPDAGRTWYVAAYWHEHGESMLLRSRDGRSWETVSRIHRGDGNDETAIEFLPDGRLLATARLEITPDRILGHRDACTPIAVAEPPYVEWHSVRSRLTRLDRPVLFRHSGSVYAVARRQVGRRGWLTRLGGLPSRKSTALVRVDRDWPWLLALFLPSEIRMARIPLAGLEALSRAEPG